MTWHGMQRWYFGDAVKFWVGVTDENWFRYLQTRAPAEVNFWQPSAGRRAVRLESGTPFLFKLHAPTHRIVGGGFYVRYSALPARLAWEAFGENNGVADYASLRRRVQQYRTAPFVGDPEIGCNVLNSPVFLEERDWINVPSTWARNIVQGRTFDTNDLDGAAIWSAIAPHLDVAAGNAESLTMYESRFGAEYLTRARLGQGAFRVLVTEAYDRRCAISGEKTLPVLEAAHIRPYSESGPHSVSNGLLLRSDLHRLFDDGYVTVTDDLRIEVSKRIREEFENGREYYRFHGQELEVRPRERKSLPSPDFLRWHNENRFMR